MRNYGFILLGIIKYLNFLETFSLLVLIDVKKNNWTLFEIEPN